MELSAGRHAAALRGYATYRAREGTNGRKRGIELRFCPMEF